MQLVKMLDEKKYGKVVLDCSELTKVLNQNINEVDKVEIFGNNASIIIENLANGGKEIDLSVQIYFNLSAVGMKLW